MCCKVNIWSCSLWTIIVYRTELTSARVLLHREKCCILKCQYAPGDLLFRWETVTCRHQLRLCSPNNCLQLLNRYYVSARAVSFLIPVLHFSPLSNTLSIKSENSLSFTKITSQNFIIHFCTVTYLQTVIFSSRLFRWQNIFRGPHFHTFLSHFSVLILNNVKFVTLNTVGNVSKHTGTVNQSWELMMFKFSIPCSPDE